MKQSAIIFFALIFFFSCRKENEVPAPETDVENPDWYILRAPENREIQAVYGDIDGTLLITDRHRIYLTTNKGKTWKQTDYNSQIGLAGFTMRNDTLFVLDTETSNSNDPGNRYAIRPYYFSVNGGTSWQLLRQYPGISEMKTPINYATSANGIRFSIDRVFYTNGRVEDVGIKADNGRKISLPQQHALSSIYFDQKSRLYVAGSSPLCEINGYMQLCDKNDIRGTLYVSRKAIN